MTTSRAILIGLLIATALPQAALAQQPESAPSVEDATADAIRAAEDAVATRPEGASVTQDTILQVIASPADATIKRGEEVLGQGSARVTLAPGSHPITIEREGYKTLIETVIISEASPESIILRTHLSKLPPDAAQVGREGGIIERLEDNGRKAIGWSALGVGTGLVVTSIALAFATRVPDGCGTSAPEQCVDVRDATGLVSAAGIVGGAGVIAGISLLAWDGLAGRPVSVGLAPKKDGAAASLRFVW